MKSVPGVAVPAPLVCTTTVLATPMLPERLTVTVDTPVADSVPAVAPTAQLMGISASVMVSVADTVPKLPRDWLPMLATTVSLPSTKVSASTSTVANARVWPGAKVSVRAVVLLKSLPSVAVEAPAISNTMVSVCDKSRVRSTPK